jgi:two-component system, OmpR family, phosphate regulon sensor histidine kinase PhoR
VGRVLSTRRLVLACALGSALLIVLAGNAWHRRGCRQQPAAHESLEAIQRLMTAAYREMPEDRFSSWLASSNLRAWAPPGWNICWLSPGPSVRWSIHPVDPGEFTPGILEAIRTVEQSPNAPAQCLCRQDGRHPGAIHIFRLSPDNPEAGFVLLRAPLARVSPGLVNLGIAVLLLAALLLGLFALNRWLFLRNLRPIFRASDFPPLPGFATDQAIESWARQVVATASRQISETLNIIDRLFDILQDGTLLIDGENSILRANKTATTLLDEKADTLVGRRLSDLADHDILESLVGDIRSTGIHQTDEIQLGAAAMLCHVAGMPFQDGDTPGCTKVMLVLRDLTRIRQLERAGEEYAVNVSHELKTPLTLILGYTETLLSHADMAPEFRDRSLHTIERHAKRIIRIIDDLLRLAWLRNEADTVGIPRATVLVTTVVDDVVSICREWARSAGLAIETHVPEGLAWSLNSGLMEEALVNLVKNAILYALVGPIEIRARVLENGNLEIAVVDRGPGLKPEDANRIFDRFYRVDKSRSRASGGSGLGLPIVQQIVDGHRGTARVETAPGAGCTFLLEIPPS